MTILAVVFYVLGTSALVSLAVYAWLASRGESRTLYSTADNRICSSRAYVFVGFAAIGFLVCMHQGAEAMLGWMPDSWGWVGEDGKYVNVAGLLAVAFALWVGGSLVLVIAEATPNSFFLRGLTEENTHLKKLLNGSLDDEWLESLKRDFEQRIANLETEPTRSDVLLHDDLSRPRAHLWPEGERILLYHDLIALAERQQGRLRQAAEQAQRIVAAALEEENTKREMARQPNPSSVVSTEGQQPEPVTSESPLVGLETLVLKTWLENSPDLRKRYRQSPANRSDLENAVRLKVDQTFQDELNLRADGMTQEQAEEFTRPAMWTPPTWPTMPTSPPDPEAKLLGTSSSTASPRSPKPGGPPSSTTT